LKKKKKKVAKSSNIIAQLATARHDSLPLMKMESAQLQASAFLRMKSCLENIFSKVVDPAVDLAKQNTAPLFPFSLNHQHCFWFFLI